jgi:hypothetical protein
VTGTAREFDGSSARAFLDLAVLIHNSDAGSLCIVDRLADKIIGNRKVSRIDWWSLRPATFSLNR